MPTLFSTPCKGHIWLCAGKVQFIQNILWSYYFYNCTFNVNKLVKATAFKSISKRMPVMFACSHVSITK